MGRLKTLKLQGRKRRLERRTTIGRSHRLGPRCRMGTEHRSPHILHRILLSSKYYPLSRHSPPLPQQISFPKPRTKPSSSGHKTPPTPHGKRSICRVNLSPMLYGGLVGVRAGMCWRLVRGIIRLLCGRRDWMGRGRRWGIWRKGMGSEQNSGILDDGRRFAYL